MDLCRVLSGKLESALLDIAWKGLKDASTNVMHPCPFSVTISVLVCDHFPDCQCGYYSGHAYGQQMDS